MFFDELAGQRKQSSLSVTNLEVVVPISLYDLLFFEVVKIFRISRRQGRRQREVENNLYSLSVVFVAFPEYNV